MEFLSPGWWWLGLVLPVAWFRWRPALTPARMVFFLLLLAALADPVWWREHSIAADESSWEQERNGELLLRHLATLVSPGLLEGEKFPARVIMEVSAAGRGKFRIFQNGILVAEREVHLESGRQEIVFPDLTAQGPVLLLDAWIDFQPEVPADGTTPAVAEQSLRAQSAHNVSGSLDVVLVQSQENPVSGAAWQEEGEGIRLRVVGGESVRRNPGLLFPADVIVLDDMPVEDWDEDLWLVLRRWVQESGGSLLQSGGPVMDAVEAFAGERSLFFPLEFAPPQEDEEARAVLVVLDRSGSMGQRVGGQSKMALANEGTARVASALRPGDWFGVLAVDVVPLVVLPLSPWRDTVEARDKIRDITPGGGGIYIDTALRESWRQLRSAAPQQRHLLVFADADDVEEKFEGEMTGSPGDGRPSLDLATLMRADQITISVVALGLATDKDTPWLEELAARGRGRFHRTGDARQLPALFTMEADEAGLTDRQSDPFFASPTVAGERLFSGVEWDAAPPLLDQNEASARRGAEVWLTGRGGEPLLAVWRQGRGQVATFATSWRDGWAVEWDRWPGADVLRSTLLRWLTPARQAGDWEIILQEEPVRHLMISALWLPTDVPPPASPPAFAAGTVDGKNVKLVWELSGPGHWKAYISRPPVPLVLESGAGEDIPAVIWNPSPTRAQESFPALAASGWFSPVFLRPWLLALLVAWLAVAGPPEIPGARHNVKIEMQRFRRRV